MIRGVAPARDRPTVWHGANGAPVAKDPDGQVKLPHLWPPKLPRAGRGSYAGSEGVTRRAEASFRR
jgi:hypothetical protein